ncbi:chitobiase/beta-hexosaminidase C-terminal domain-containing protein [Paenibacillus eucommiae]|uniref:Cadherin domain-containing protein n=1 Tax=Paenibacillus eucommiae TaxID=1355755 RepID=A0ABS4J7C5_9BACL|nr:chitobiase/beta-hexosaminidase C-terminal domain-containing protein [Paenibacillus eucommiae]MBP1995713.1 hypothetical protein [Paenibacillus eucommiae]
MSKKLKRERRENKKKMSKWIAASAVIAPLAYIIPAELTALAAPPEHIQPFEEQTIVLGYNETFNLSDILQSSGELSYQTVHVQSPAVADAAIINGSKLRIGAKKLGTTVITLLSANGNAARFRLTVTENAQLNALSEGKIHIDDIIKYSHLNPGKYTNKEDYGTLLHTLSAIQEMPNQAPALTTGHIPTQQLDRNQVSVLFLDDFIGDEDGDLLSYGSLVLSYNSAVLSAGFVSAELTGGVLSIRGVSRGTGTLTLTAKDSNNAQTVVGFQVQISNSAPEAIHGATLLATPNPVGLGAVVSVNVGSYFTDPDGDALSYSAYLNDGTTPLSFQLANSGSVMKFSDLPEGTYNITIAANDGHEGVFTSEVEVTVDHSAPAAPTASIEGGWYNADQSITLSGEENAKIYYTLDGSVPTKENGILYAGAINITQSATLKAIVVDRAGNASSPPLEAAYYIDKEVPVAPVASVEGGWYNVDQSVTLIGEADCKIYYTLNGSTPTKENGVLYTGAINVTQSAMLKAIVVDRAGNVSLPLEVTYHIDKEVPPAPVTNVVGGWYNVNQSLLLSAEVDARIYYTLDGSEPVIGSLEYSDAIGITVTTTLKAIAVDRAGNISPVLAVTYFIDKEAPVAPVASIPEGLYNVDQSVTLSGEEHTKIYYTLDGTIPTTNSSEYLNAINITSTTTLKAIAVDRAGNISSPAFVVTYHIDKEAPAAPEASVAGGLYNKNQSVILSAEVDAKIYYTLDGSTPSINSPEYTGAINITETTMLKAIAVDGAGNISSSLLGVLYQIDKEAPAAPTANVPEGWYNVNQSVTLNGEAEGKIYYTLDGTIPNTSSPEYTGAIYISQTTTLRAIVVDRAGNVSLLPLEITYHIDKEAPLEPVANVMGGWYNVNQSVTLSGEMDAKIYYTLDGSEPTLGSLEYMDIPISITQTTTLKAITVDRAGNISTPALIVTYHIDKDAPEAPFANIPDGLYNTVQSVTLSGETDAKIYFTLDGSQPTINSPEYIGTPIYIAQSTMLKAIAVDRAGNISLSMLEVTYEIDKEAPAAPTASIPEGFYNAEQIVMLSGEADAKIYYTLDGSEPEINSNQEYNGENIYITQTTTLKAIAVDRAGNVSPVLNAAYEIVSDQDAVSIAAVGLEIGYVPDDTQEHVTQNVVLPTTGANGVLITWESNSSLIDAGTGTVTRPEYGEENTLVGMIATLTKGNVTQIKEFPPITVLAYSTPNPYDVGILDGNYEGGWTYYLNVFLADIFPNPNEETLIYSMSVPEGVWVTSFGEFGSNHPINPDSFTEGELSFFVDTSLTSGIQTIPITATYPGGTVSYNLQMTIENRAPRMHEYELPEYGIKANEHATFDLSKYFYDPDGDPLNFEIVSSDDLSLVSQSGGMFTFSASGTAQNTNTVTFAVYDSNYNYYEQYPSFNVHVVDNIFQVNEDESLTDGIDLTEYFQDTYGFGCVQLTYNSSIVADLDSGGIISVSGNYSGTSTIHVRDANISDRQADFFVKVNGKPWIDYNSYGLDSILKIGESKTFSLNPHFPMSNAIFVEDPEFDPLTYSIEADNNISIVWAPDQRSFTVAYTGAGDPQSDTVSFSFTATDAHGAQKSKVIELSVFGPDDFLWEPDTDERVMYENLSSYFGEVDSASISYSVTITGPEEEESKKFIYRIEDNTLYGQSGYFDTQRWREYIMIITATDNNAPPQIRKIKIVVPPYFGPM